MELDVLQRYTHSSQGAIAEQVCRPYVFRLCFHVYTCACAYQPCYQFNVLMHRLLHRQYPTVILFACVVLRESVLQVSPHSLQPLPSGAT